MKKYYFLLFFAVVFSSMIFVAKFFIVKAQPGLIEKISLLEIPVAPQRKTSDLALLNLEDHNLAHIGAQSFYVMDVESGAILTEKNSEKSLYPASTTKMMTALVARENYDLNDVVVINNSIKMGGSGIGLIIGEEISVENLLYGLLIPSGNDAAYALASYDPGGIDSFVDRMNLKAKQLGLINTYFQNPAGFDHEDQVSTARDLAILGRELLKDNFLSHVVSLSEATIFDVKNENPRVIKNTNYLLGKIEGVKGIKTGTTLLAGEVLVTLVERDGHQIIISLLASQDRFLETEQIINWVFENYGWV